MVDQKLVPFAPLKPPETAEMEVEVQTSAQDGVYRTRLVAINNILILHVCVSS